MAVNKNERDLTDFRILSGNSMPTQKKATAPKKTVTEMKNRTSLDDIYKNKLKNELEDDGFNSLVKQGVQKKPVSGPKKVSTSLPRPNYIKLGQLKSHNLIATLSSAEMDTVEVNGVSVDKNLFGSTSSIIEVERSNTKRYTVIKLLASLLFVTLFLTLTLFMSYLSAYNNLQLAITGTSGMVEWTIDGESSTEGNLNGITENSIVNLELALKKQTSDTLYIIINVEAMNDGEELLNYEITDWEVNGWEMIDDYTFAITWNGSKGDTLIFCTGFNTPGTQGIITDTTYSISFTANVSKV